MSSVLQEPCLVLNKNWAPLGTVPVQKAFHMIFNNRATIIEHPSYQQFTWDDWRQLRPAASDEKIKAGDLYFRVPEIILLTHYDRLPDPKVHFSRRNLFKRDNMTCQYCGAKPGSAELTIDHVVPRSLGGMSTWDNCVLACIKCNTKKANRPLEKCGLKLAKKPKKPHVNPNRIDTLKRVKSWEDFLGLAYWNVGIGEGEDSPE